ncbi:MAG: cytidylyltransferase domain-containing protein [Flavobacteriales bacterium]|jgi:CMP-N-acetylneuraminic acid synthetase
MRTIVIIPARGGSKRLPKKNIYPFKGKPLIAYTIEACKACSFIDGIYVSSDDHEILDVSVQFGARPLLRPTELADDQTPKIVAIRQAVQDASIGALDRDDIVIVAQANSPQISAEQLQQAHAFMVHHKLWEVMSTDENGVQNAAFRLVRYHALFNEFLSAHCGFVVAPNIDVHTLEDINAIS